MPWGNPLISGPLGGLFIRGAYLRRTRVSLQIAVGPRRLRGAFPVPAGVCAASTPTPSTGETPPVKANVIRDILSRHVRIKPVINDRRFIKMRFFSGQTRNDSASSMKS